MAIDLQDKTNVNAPSPAFPYGDVRDNTGSNDGTPFDRVTFSDYIQFFHKMFSESGLIYNNVLDDDNNGFQFFEALIQVIRSTGASISLKGTVEKATQAEVSAGTDTIRYVTPSGIKGANKLIPTAALADFAVTASKIGPNAITTSKVLDEAITNIKIALATIERDRVASGHFVLTPSGSPQKYSKRIDIGAWDVYDGGAALTGFTIAHGLTGSQWKTAAVTSIMIRNDSDTIRTPLNVSESIGGADGTYIDSTSIVFTSGAFAPNDGEWDSEAFSRGYVDIEYEV